MTDSLNIRQSTDFRINELCLLTKGGKVKLNEVYEEINIYESMLAPCISGNILIRDAVGLTSKLLFDGTESLLIDIDKGEGLFRMKRLFRVYSQSDRVNINQTSESYILNFASDEIVLSEQQTLAECYKGTYTQIAQKIITSKLLVDPENLNGVFTQSLGMNDIIIPQLKPFDALNWIAKRAIDSGGQPSFMFFENVEGYNFCTLSDIMKRPVMFNVFFDVKNLQGQNIKEEMISVRAMEVMSQFDFIKSTQSGVFAGTFIGIDPLTRQVRTEIKTVDNVYNGTRIGNQNPNLPIEFNKKGQRNVDMPGSRVVVDISTAPRQTSKFIKDNDGTSIQTDDTPQKFAYARKALLQNFVTQRMKIALPGNFIVSPGRTLYMEVPTRSVNLVDSNNYDITLKGKYAILSTRHIIRYNQFETIAEVVTNSSEKPLVQAPKVTSRKVTDTTTKSDYSGDGNVVDLSLG